MFQHTAARRRLGLFISILSWPARFQHTAARRRLDLLGANGIKKEKVSTHSRPKAAGSGVARSLMASVMFQHTAARRRLELLLKDLAAWFSFNTQPPEGGWFVANHQVAVGFCVSTHSRPKAAGASLKSLAPSGFAALISLSSQEKREREYNTAFSVTPTFAIS